MPDVRDADRESARPPLFDNGDHLHPNDKGMQAKADAVDLKSVDCASAPN
ncbi:hypothetical protein [Streptomyces atratus]|nr:hypothetical protein [Streptomyces atratus]MCX5345029.1 hypothetical protein [Streptomyces atratus]